MDRNTTWTSESKATFLRKLPREKASAWFQANPTQLEVLGLYVFPDSEIIPSTSPPSERRLVSAKKKEVWDRWRNRDL